MDKLINYLEYINIPTNSLMIMLIALLLILILLVIILIIKSNSKQSENISFIDEVKTSSILDSKLNKDDDIAIKIDLDDTKANKDDKFDISSATKKMKEDIENENIDLTDFEIEQEEKSIISYKELLEKVNKDKENTNVSRVEFKDDNIEELKQTRLSKNTDYKINSEIINIDKKIDEDIKPKKTKAILNIEGNNYSHDEFLKSLKSLKDNLG